MAEPTALPRQVSELRDLVVAYAKQETLEPLKLLARSLALWLAGALLLGLGVVFLSMAALRALQEETGDTFTGGWSWVPYAIVVVALVLGAAVTWRARRVRGPRRTEAASR